MNKVNMTRMNNNKRKSASTAFIAITLLVASAVFTSTANAVEYDVEVIIFENTRDTNVGSSDTLLMPVIRNAQRIPDAPAPGQDIQPIGELRLLSEVEKIKNSTSHRLLYHGGWRQDEIDQENAPYMGISLGRSFDMLIEPPGASAGAFGGDLGSNLGRESEEDNRFLRGYLNPPVDNQLRLTQTRSAALQGGIKVWVGRFLHFETLLAYTPPGADYSFAFESERRMRSRQLHYIDNSRVGIITKIFPVDNSAPN